MRTRRRPRTWRGLLAVLLLVALLPVPWQLRGDSSVGLAFRLDSRLQVDGQPIEVSGRYSWLTAGRPAVLGELFLDRYLGQDLAVRDLREGHVALRPDRAVPLATAVGLRHAGRDAPIVTLVELADPTDPDAPPRVRLRNPAGSVAAYRTSRGVELDTDGQRWSLPKASGDELVLGTGPVPYTSVMLRSVTPGTRAQLGGDVPLHELLRTMSTGSSHGMMVALAAYDHATGGGLATGLHVAGTGTVDRTGRVGRIGGLDAKAGAARRAGADILLVPDSQRSELEDFDPGGMRIVGVETLDEAIAALAAHDRGQA